MARFIGLEEVFNPLFVHLPIGGVLTFAGWQVANAASPKSVVEFFYPANRGTPFQRLSFKS